MSVRAFLDGRVELHAGSCLDVLPTLAENSFDSAVMDPPYHLTSIVKRFGADGSSPARAGKTGAYARASAGFMGKRWDGGDVAFRPETWAAVLRVLKPGAHLIAFSGTRTYHRLAVAIEDAGFEIRDQIGWAYGSGFPKSHDVSKGIDKAAPRRGMFAEFARHYAGQRSVSGLTHNAICAAGGFFAEHNHGGASTNWEKGNNVPTVAQWAVLKPLLGLSDEFLPLIERVEAEREKVGERKSGDPVAWYGEAERGDGVVDITIPATSAARQWEGWGTALKPAWEPICLARKPLSGTVVENVLEHGTGALNIEGCRVPGEGNKTFERMAGNRPRDQYRTGTTGVAMPTDLGRWPANLIHDGSDEVLAGFPETVSGSRAEGVRKGIGYGSNATGDGGPALEGSEGSAARFFYTAKADAEDRIGSKHPTVKPLDLMQYLVRLVTPKGGLVLDCFAGTGTTGEAAWREGMRAVLIEAEPEYQADIARRMELAQNPTKRAAVAKSKNNLQGAEGTPLFGDEAA